MAVSSGATWNNLGTGDLILSGGVSNSGTITFNANGNGCGQNDDISITSSVPATQRAWSGSGTFNLTDVSVQDQGGTAIIGVRSGTSVSGNGPNWPFVSQCSAYTWTQAVTTDWTNPLNWSPARTTTAATDILIFAPARQHRPRRTWRASPAAPTKPLPSCISPMASWRLSAPDWRQHFEHQCRPDARLSTSTD